MLGTLGHWKEEVVSTLLKRGPPARSLSAYLDGILAWLLVCKFLHYRCFRKICTGEDNALS